MVFLSILTKGNINMNIFGNIVKHFLVDNNLQQNDIAKNANITKANVSQLLNRDNISLVEPLITKVTRFLFHRLRNLHLHRLKFYFQ